MCSKFLTSSPYIRKYAFHANKLNNGYELKKKVQKSSPGGPWFAGERPTVQGRWRPTSGGRRPCLAAPTSGEVETMKQFIATEQKKIHNRTKREQNIKTWKIKISYKPLGGLLWLFGQWLTQVHLSMNLIHLFDLIKILLPIIMDHTLIGPAPFFIH